MKGKDLFLYLMSPPPHEVAGAQISKTVVPGNLPKASPPPCSTPDSPCLWAKVSRESRSEHHRRGAETLETMTFPSCYLASYRRKQRKLKYLI